MSFDVKTIAPDRGRIRGQELFVNKIMLLDEQHKSYLYF